MAKKQKLGFTGEPLTEEAQVILEWTMSHENLLVTTFFHEYMEKLDEANWGFFKISSKEEMWTEASHQAKLMHDRIFELEGDTSSDAKCERAILIDHARDLLEMYQEDESALMPGVPAELVAILKLEYPGHDAVLNLIANKERKPGHKFLAIQLVKKTPNVSQGELAYSVDVTDAAIRKWSPELLAAGWQGPQQTAKSEEPVKPESPEPGTPSLAKLKFMEGDGPEDN